jgi:hypothetical protein
MTDTSTLTRPGAAGSRRGAPSRLQRVDDFLGEHANEAAQAVRRAGLKPGLERSVGHAPELLGHVIAQEPEAGAELARNGLVVLYVAAPGTSVDGQENAEPAAIEPPEGEQPTRALDRAELASDSATARRRRKTRAQSPPAFDVAPAPRPRDDGAPVDWPEHEAEIDGDVIVWERVEPREVLDDDYVIAADALFAREPDGSRRRARRRIGSLRSRLAESPILVRAGLAMLLLLWLLVAGTAALLAHGSSQAHPAAALAPGTRVATPSRQPSAPRPRRASRKPPRPPHPRLRRRRRARHAPSASIAPARQPPATSSAPTPPPAPTSSPTPAPHHEGGLFSP